jgi:hypothetical protein
MATSLEARPRLCSNFIVPPETLYKQPSERRRRAQIFPSYFFHPKRCASCSRLSSLAVTSSLAVFEYDRSGSISSSPLSRDACKCDTVVVDDLIWYVSFMVSFALWPYLTLRIGPTEVSHIDSLLVHAIITNTGDEPLKLYKDPRSSLHPFPTDTFSFTCIDDDEYTCPHDEEASPPEFIGAKAKYTFETANDFVNLAVGESINVTHQSKWTHIPTVFIMSSNWRTTVSSAYNFTHPGSYAINATNTFHYVDPVTHKPQVIHGFFTNTHASRVTGNLVSDLIERRNPVLARELYVTAGVDVSAMPAELDLDVGLPGVDLKASANQGPKFEGCTPAQKDQISTALDPAIQYLDNSVSYLETFPAPSASLRYKEWFGTASFPSHIGEFTDLSTS